MSATLPARRRGLFFAYRPFLSLLLANIRAQEVDFWNRAKTRTVMLWAGLASFAWGTSTWLERESTFNGPSYVVMRTLLPAWCWAFIFISHTALVLTCRWWIGGAPRALQLATCYYGFVIWSFYVVATDISLDTWYAPGTSTELVMVLFLGWSLRRAGRRPADEAADRG